jgi:hypothetical protein
MHAAHWRDIPLLLLGQVPCSCCHVTALMHSHALSTGSVLVIRMDLRSQKFPDKSSVMSSCQMNWLKQQLSQCAAHDLVILVSSFNWIGAPEGALYGWAEFTADRVSVANAIESNQCTDKLILLAGDAHMLAFDDGANSNYAATGSSNSKGFPVVRPSCPCPRRCPTIV